MPAREKSQKVDTTRFEENEAKLERYRGSRGTARKTAERLRREQSTAPHLPKRTANER
jgi:hypothetical protein